MRRRQFIAGLGSAAAWPVVARAQQPAMPVIGLLSPQSAEDDYKNRTVPFLQALKETGWLEGQNVALEYRYAENQLDRLPALAADLVRRRVAVIVADGNLAALHPQRRETSRSAGRAGRKNRADSQPQNRQSPRPYHPRNAFGHRRRGDQ